MQGHLVAFWADLDFNEKYDVINNLRDQFTQETVLNERNMNKGDKLFTLFQVFKDKIMMDSFENIQQHYDKYIRQNNGEEFIDKMLLLDLRSFGSIKTIINRLIYKKLL